jgi:hypothetical protein
MTCEMDDIKSTNQKNVGWFQGILVDIGSVHVHCHTWNEESSNWEIKSGDLAAGELLVIVSQTCDILKEQTKEPFVEAIRAFWAEDPSIIREAGRNSARYFLLQQRKIGDSNQGLIADATFRVLIDKAALRQLKPVQCFNAEDEKTLRKFSNWLGHRYSRPAIPDNYVRAIQRPIVQAIEKLSDSNPLQGILDRLAEIRFAVENSEGKPLKANFIFLEDGSGETGIDPESMASFAGWIAERLSKTGLAELADWQLLSYEQISVADYFDTHQLPLDHFTLAETIEHE